MVQRIVRHIIAHVADEEEAPKDGKANGVWDGDELWHESATDEESYDCQSWRVD